MSHIAFFQRTLFALTAALLISMPHGSFAQEADAPAAQAEAVAPAKSKAAAPAKTEAPASAMAGNKTAKEAPLSPTEKAAAIAAADKIGAFEADKVVGIAKPWDIYFEPSASPVAEQLEKLHDFIFVIICVITAVVTALLLYVMLRFNARANPTPKRFAHNTTVEIVWTVIPILILIAIGIPSVRAHFKYVRNENIINNADITLKVTGHQWYWSYEYPDMGIAYDSHITKEKDLKPGEPRLLTVDNPVVVPVGKTVRVQMTSADVIHAWVVPSFAVDMAAVPGRLNETWFRADKPGIYYGQCQQLCGKYHGFMPIMVKAVTSEEFAVWVKGAKQKFAANSLMQFAALN